MGRGVRAEPLTRPVGQGSSRAAPGFDWTNPHSRPKNQQRKEAEQIHLISQNNIMKVTKGNDVRAMQCNGQQGQQYEREHSPEQAERQPRDIMARMRATPPRHAAEPPGRLPDAPFLPAELK